ncbi:MAG TPA: helix-turn-helix domain-containing protein [Gaiellaceae bacterium]|jgi:transcriptional regulator GlxA family with amidase domain
MRTVAAVVDQGALTFDFAIPCEVFGLDRSDIATPWYEFLVVAAGDRRIVTQTGFVIEAPLGLAALDRADTIIVPGWSSPDIEPSGDLIAALRRAHNRQARIVSICTGAFVLAAAGLLDGRRATTHWLFVDELRTRYPRIELDPSVLYVVDGTIMTSAGTAAGIDLCLHIVTADYGADVAATVSRRMLMPLHRSGGQAQYVDTPVPQALGDEMTELLAWAVTSIPTGLSVDDLARRAAVSPRTLTRRFRQATGLAPGEWLRNERLRLARRLLETSEDPIERVAQHAGYDTPVAMRAQFARRLHTSPRAYRRTFRAA